MTKILQEPSAFASSEFLLGQSYTVVIRTLLWLIMCITAVIEKPSNPVSDEGFISMTLLEPKLDKVSELHDRRVRAAPSVLAMNVQQWIVLDLKTSLSLNY